MSLQAEADRLTQDRGVGRWLVFWRSLSAVLIIAGCGAAYYAYKQDLDARIMLAILGVFSGIGIFYLLCSSMGVCRFMLADPRSTPVAAFLNHMPDAVVITGSGGSIRYTNSSYNRLAGSKQFTPEILLARDEKAAQAVYRLSLAAKEGRTAYDEIRVLNGIAPQETETPDGRVHVYAVNVSPMEVDGETLIIWIIADFTNVRDRQETLFEDLQEAINHLDYSPAGFVSWDPLGRVTYLNTTLAAWLGMDLAQFVPGSLTLASILGADKMTELETALAEAGDDGVVLDIDLVSENVEPTPIRLYIGASQNDLSGGGQMRALMVKRVPETAVQEVAAVQNLPVPVNQTSVRFEDFFLTSPIALATMDEKGGIKHANARFTELFAVASAIEEGKLRHSLVSLIHPRDHAKVRAAAQEIFGGDQDVALIDTVFADQDERYIRLYISPLRQGEADVEPLVIISVVETTEQRALEQQMEQSQKMQAVGQLAGGIAHDFNNVLTAIIMSCDLLLSNHRSSDPSHPDIMNIKNNANRAASLVRQLLAFSRRQTLRPAILDLTDMLADLRMLVDRLVGSTIQLKIEHGRDLWPVKADQAELERVIMNLAANARDAMPDGGKLTIRTANVSEEDAGEYSYQGFKVADYVLIEVSDSGTGIPSEIREKIFDPFFTTKEVGKGTGLGLSMVYGIVTQTGGCIYCDSEPGEGTRFSIFLPRYIIEPSEEEPQTTLAISDKKREETRPIDLSGSATVLVVEDEDAVRMGGVKALQSRGYTVFEASTGVEALEIIEEHSGDIDIVVSDVVMPEMDGPTLLKELRKIHPSIKFIFVSGYAEDAFAKNLPEDAKFAFLPKPFSLKQLATAVKEMLEEGKGD